MSYLCAVLAALFAFVVLAPHAEVHAQYAPAMRSSR